MKKYTNGDYKRDYRTVIKTRKCKRCPKQIESYRALNAVYCESCSIELKREQNRYYEWKKRKLRKAPSNG